MYNLIEVGASLFSRRPLNSVRITGAVYDSHNIAALQKLKQRNNFNFINVNDPAIYRGVSIEHYLGSLTHPGLGMTTMRPELARYLKSKGLTSVEELSFSEKEELINAHVNGYSFTKGNTKVAHSFTYCSSVALGFGIDAAKKSYFPNLSLIGISRNVSSSSILDVNYDPLTADGEHRGTSIFAYQCETLVPYLISPMHHCIVVNPKTSNIITLDDLKQAKRFDASEQSILKLSTVTPENIKKYQQLEIDKVIAHDDFVKHVESTGNPKDLKAIELYEKYNSLAKEQAELVNLSICKKELWVNIAAEVAPKSYNCVSAHNDGFTIELPQKNGGTFVANVSNFQAKILLAPLFETDPTLTLEHVKNGDIPSALNYLAETVIRKNKELICQTGLEQCVEEEQQQQQNLSIT